MKYLLVSEEALKIYERRAISLGEIEDQYTRRCLVKSRLECHKVSAEPLLKLLRMARQFHDNQKDDDAKKRLLLAVFDCDGIKDKYD